MPATAGQYWGCDGSRKLAIARPVRFLRHLQAAVANDADHQHNHTCNADRDQVSPPFEMPGEIERENSRANQSNESAALQISKIPQK
jgi:hypothetical protein